jgi:hypothetical protein
MVSLRRAEAALPPACCQMWGGAVKKRSVATKCSACDEPLAPGAQPKDFPRRVPRLSLSKAAESDSSNKAIFFTTEHLQLTTSNSKYSFSNYSALKNSNTRSMYTLCPLRPALSSIFFIPNSLAQTVLCRFF